MKYIVLSILLSCAANEALKQPRIQSQGRQQAQEQNTTREEVVEALKSETFESFKALVDDIELTDKHTYHNYLTDTLACAQDGRQKAEYLLETKKAFPKEVRLTALIGGPLENSLKNGCTDLAHFYLNVLSPNEIASGSRNYRAFRSSYTQPDRPSILASVPFQANTILAAISKNKDFCKKGLEQNCDASEHLRKEREILLREAEISSFQDFCNVSKLKNKKKRLMDHQLKFGIATKNSSPKTYDKHAEVYEDMIQKQEDLKNLYKYLTGNYPKESDCL